MCMAIPMKVVEVNGYEARCEARGAERLVNTALLGDNSVEAGEYLMVHAGCAACKVSREEAKSIWMVIEKALEIEYSRSREAG